MGSRWYVKKKEDRVINVDPMMTPMSRVFRTPVNWLWPGRIVKDNLTLLTGDPGVGKSIVKLRTKVMAVLAVLAALYKTPRKLRV